MSAAAYLGKASSGLVLALQYELASSGGSSGPRSVLTGVQRVRGRSSGPFLGAVLERVQEITQRHLHDLQVTSEDPWSIRLVD